MVTVARIEMDSLFPEREVSSEGFANISAIV